MGVDALRLNAHVPGDRVAEEHPPETPKHGELDDQDERDIAPQQAKAPPLPLPRRQGLAVGQATPDGLGHTPAGWYRRGLRGAMRDTLSGLLFRARDAIFEVADGADQAYVSA